MVIMQKDTLEQIFLEILYYVLKKPIKKIEIPRLKDKYNVITI